MGSALIRAEDVKFVFQNDDKKTMTIGMNNGQKHIVPRLEGMQIAKAVEKINKAMDGYYERNGGGIIGAKAVTPERSRIEQRISSVRGEICRGAVQKRPRD